MNSIRENLERIWATLPPHVKLIAVSKTKPAEMLLEAYEAGQKYFGENYVQDLMSKQPGLPSDMEFHFIGHLQTNKVKYIAPFISCIQSVDSLKVLKEINKQASKNHRIIDCMLEFSIAENDSKFGLDIDEARELLTSDACKAMQSVRIIGVMGMGSFSDDMARTRREYKKLKQIFDELKTEFFAGNEAFKEISMGMSSDYQLAIEEGSTMVRVGTDIFGARNYQE
ncbi:MAG: YggS family pyridoxal phosphate-dependent enzyme [Marinilabiliales bacterium]|nr:MAG: YggS family pyridoxal phosphate-dependent enzyme [Marinilabiliales bacterium]